MGTQGQGHQKDHDRADSHDAQDIVDGQRTGSGRQGLKGRTLGAENRPGGQGGPKVAGVLSRLLGEQGANDSRTDRGRNLAQDIEE